MFNILHLEFWKDWGEIILAIVGIIVAYILWKKQAQKKRLTSQIEVISFFNENARNSSGNVLVSYEGKELESLYIALVSIENTGQLSIKSSDFESEIFYNLKCKGEDIKLLDWELDQEDKKRLNIEYSASSQLQIKGMLLNPNDSFTMIIFSESRPDFHQIEARINGINEISKLSNDYNIDSNKLIYILSRDLSLISGGATTSILLIIMSGQLNGESVILQWKYLVLILTLLVPIMILVIIGTMYFKHRQVPKG